MLSLAAVHVGHSVRSISFYSVLPIVNSVSLLAVVFVCRPACAFVLPALLAKSNIFGCCFLENANFLARSKKASKLY